MLFDITRITTRPDAQEWLSLWGDYSRACDNLVDSGERTPARMVESWALGNRCYSHPFYRANAHLLQSACLMATSLWSLSCDWEKDAELWKRQWADVLRHADVAIVLAVCLICGASWESCQDVTRAFLVAGRVQHKEKYGEPT